jgi:hypothetical protein
MALQIAGAWCWERMHQEKQLYLALCNGTKKMLTTLLNAHCSSAKEKEQRSSKALAPTVRIVY